MGGGRGLDLSGATWITSRRSSAQGNNCVQVARNLPGVVAVRDSKALDGPVLLFPAGQWRVFTRQVKAGVLDLG